MILRAFLIWLVIIAAESIHGILRGLLLEPFAGDFRARQIGVFIGSAIILTITYFFFDYLKARSFKALLSIGLFWAILTLAFEISLGRLLGFGWDRILEDYDILNGGLMPFGIIFLILSPLFAAWIKIRHSTRIIQETRI